MTHREAIERAIEAIKKVCREEDGEGQRVIGDLSTWEIEAAIIKAVTAAIKAR